MKLKRCDWCTQDPLYIAYHDHEWGIPLHDDKKLFEMLILEGMQAGLSWLTILKKRKNFQLAFDDFNPEIIASYSPQKLEELLADAGIIRNRLKIAAVVKNAQAFLKIKETMGSFDRYIWQFTEYKPIQNAWKNHQQIPVSTPLSEKISKDLKQRGFTFVGATICYAYMQAVGIVNDHLVGCISWKI